MKRVLSFLVLVGIFLVLTFSLFADSAYTTTDSAENYRQTLLGFYTQELVAHGAMLFAASAATFRFITGLVEKTNKRWGSSAIFMVFSGFLIGLTIFLGFRLLYYGALTHGATTFPISPIEYNSYDKFVAEVEKYTEEKAAPLPDLFRTIRRGTLDTHPFSILPVSLYMGYAFTYLVFYAFGCHSLRGKRPFILLLFFLIPAVIGFVCAFCNVASNIAENSKGVLILTCVIVIWYTLLIGSCDSYIVDSIKKRLSKPAKES